MDIDDYRDRQFKPGLMEQTRAFLDGDRSYACLPADQIQLLPVYEAIAGYR